MACLFKLPCEILLMIIEAPLVQDPEVRKAGRCFGSRLAATPQDIYHLMLVCRDFFDLLEPVLYKTDKRHGASYAVTWAAKHGITETLDTALSYGLNIRETALDITSILHPHAINWSYATRGRYPVLGQIFRSDRSGPGFEVETHSPLQHAVVHGQDRAVAWFLDHGLNIEGDDQTQSICSRGCFRNQHQERVSLLHVALCHGHASTALLLIARGASLQYHRPNDTCSTTDRDIFKHLDSRETMHALLEAALYGLDEVVVFLARQKDISIAAISYHSFNALAFAAMGREDRVASVKQILDIDSDLINGIAPSLWRHENHATSPSAPILWPWMCTPLHCAINQENVSVASYLLEAGAAFDQGHFAALFTKPDGSYYPHPTPVSDCVMAGRTGKRWRSGQYHQRRQDLLRQILKLGGDPNEPSMLVEPHERTCQDALAIALAYGDNEDVEILLQAGARLTVHHVEAAPFECLQSFDDKKLLLLMRYGLCIDDAIEKLQRPFGPLEDSRLDGPFIIGPIARKMNTILECATSQNFSERYLLQLVNQYLENGQYDLFLVFANHAPWQPSQDYLYMQIQRINMSQHLDQRDNLLPYENRLVYGPNVWEVDFDSVLSRCAWQQALNRLLGLCTGARDPILFLHTAIRSKNVYATNILLHRGATRDPSNSQYVPGLLLSSIDLGHMSIIKQLWRSLAVVQRHPDFVDACLREAVIAGNHSASLFFVHHGADPFHRMEPYLSNPLFDNLGIFLKASRPRSAQSEDKKYDNDEGGLLRQYHVAIYLGQPMTSQLHYKDILFLASPLQLAILCGHRDVVQAFVGGRNVPETAFDQGYYVPCVLTEAVEIEAVLARAQARLAAKSLERDLLTQR